MPSAWCAGRRAPMVKWKSCLGSNEAFRVQLLVGVLNLTIIYGVCGVAVSARLAVNQKVPVRPRPDTPEWKGRSNDQGTSAADADLEPQLAAGERGHRGPGAGAVVERVGSRRGPQGLPALHLGGLGQAAAPRRRGPHPGGAVQAAGAGSGRAERL